MQVMRTEGKKMASAQPTGHYFLLILCYTSNLIFQLSWLAAISFCSVAGQFNDQVLKLQLMSDSQQSVDHDLGSPVNQYEYSVDLFQNCCDLSVFVTVHHVHVQCTFILVSMFGLSAALLLSKRTTVYRYIVCYYNEQVSDQFL